MRYLTDHLCRVFLTYNCLSNLVYTDLQKTRYTRYLFLT